MALALCCHQLINFNLALKLHVNNLIKVILGTNGIKSGEQKIVDALQKHIGPILSRKLFVTTNQRVNYLLEIRILTKAILQTIQIVLHIQIVDLSLNIRYS